MTARPFNTSTKNPTSVKLRGLSTSKAVTRQLEVDSRTMEDRLRQLKQTMNREKEERESRGSSSLGIWASGQPGAVTTQYANDVIKKKTKKSPTLPGQSGKPKSGTKVRKIKVLKDVEIELPQRPKFKLSTMGGDSQKSFKGPACGQCEQKAVALTCMECGENYCTGCFAKFHMKGALKNHRSVPYRSPTSSRESLPVPHENGYNDPRNSRNLAIRPLSNGAKSTTGTESHSPRQEKVVRVTLKSPAPTATGGALLQGDYNEDDSASSFAAALAEWRQTKKTQGGGEQTQAAPAQAPPAPGTPRGISTSTSEGTSTSNGDISPRSRDIEIKFTETSSLSYADRLLLKKHRRTELPEAASPNLMANGGVVKDVKQQENVVKKNLVNGEVNFTDDVNLEDEHQSYVNIFSKRTNPEADHSDPRPASVLTISEVDEEDEKHIEESSSYSVQEEDSQPVIEQPGDSDSMQLNNNHPKPQSAKKTSLPAPEMKLPPQTKPPGSSSSRKSTDNKTPATPSQQTTKDNRAASKSRAQSRSSSSKPRTPQPAGKPKDGSGKSNATGRPTSKASAGKTDEARAQSRSSSSKPRTPQPALKSKEGSSKSSATVRPTGKASAGKTNDEGKCNTPTNDRPVSVGLTTRPSEGLVQVSQHHQQPQHQYKEGLGEFFTAGLTGEEMPESREQMNKSPARSSVTPTNELPECSFQGNSIWRPDSSLAASSDEALQVPYSPSPPSRSSSRPSSGKRTAQKTRQVKSPTKQIPRNPETGSPLPDDGDACGKRSSRDALGFGNTGNASRESSSRASQMGLPDRSASRIEVEGDDMTGYDDDAALTHRETSADDKDTLEQLTWELASHEGRITADGRITSMSVLEEENHHQGFGRFSHDAELGILQDDGHGSGLSTPCEITMERDELSEEDLQADFEENESCKEEVEALR